MWRSLVLLTLLASVQGRAVNISNTWVLPEEGFPVFYRYFRDRISWYEADAVCQFHHANLVTVDTTAQYDAVRAYLKELDISSAVWVGLIRSNPDGDFTWTDYRGLSGDGYWSSAPDTRSAPLCAAADPAADYRWEARACGGPTVASFICELPVPQWALGNEGCMVRELPALTILYLPESAAVQLNADCGLAGVKRVQCTGNVKREGLLKDLACAEEDEITSTFMSTNWPSTTDSTTNEDSASDVTTDENTTTEREVEPNQLVIITATLLPQYINSKAQYKSPTKFTDMDNFNRVSFSKEVNLGGNDDHNKHSNFIPKIVDEGNVLSNEQLDKLEDERHKQEKMFHEEVARVGNVDNIFTQPTDHFIPPLVMAKSRMSDDMTVLSLAEKHAQQIAEKQFAKHSQSDNSYDESNNKLISDYKLKDKTSITSTQQNKTKEIKPNYLKSHVPKKYYSEKYYAKATKVWPMKSIVIDKSASTTEIPTTIKPYMKDMSHDEDFGMDLTVMLRDAPLHQDKELKKTANYANDVAKLDKISNTNISETSTENSSPLPYVKTAVNKTIEHAVVQITVISNDNPEVNTTVTEITTKMPIFHDETEKTHLYSSPFSTMAVIKTQPTEGFKLVKSENSLNVNKNSIILNHTVTVSDSSATDELTTPNTKNILSSITTGVTSNAEVFTTSTALSINKSEITEIPTTMNPPTTYPNISDEVIVDVIDKVAANDFKIDYHNDSTVLESNVSLQKLDFNNTEVHNLLEKNMTDTDDIIDDDSPLLSGAYEPMQRPPRTRRPQQQNRKFNPFRILG